MLGCSTTVAMPDAGTLHDAAPASLEWLCTTSWTDGSGAHTHTDAFITSNTAQGMAAFTAWKESTIASCDASCSCTCSITCQQL